MRKIFPAEVMCVRFGGGPNKKPAIFFALFSFCLGAALASIPQSQPSVELHAQWDEAVRPLFASQQINQPAGTNMSYKYWRPLLQIGIENTNLWAEGFLGHIMLEEPEQPSDKQEGVRLLKDSAQRGCVLAMEELGWRYVEGKGIETDYHEAQQWLRPAADKGLPLAQAELGYCYVMGYGVAINDSEALKWFRLSAAQTNAFSLMHLGRMRLYGNGVTRDKTEAKKLLTQAAALGNARAMYFLGTIAREDSSNPNSLLEAFQWDQKSAEQGDRFGCWDLAVCYRFGNGTAKDLTNYLYWTRLAATKGVAEAQLFLGEAYRSGDGVAADGNMALHWYQTAATNGHPDACFRTAMALGYPNITSEVANRDESHRYMTQAAQAGHRPAQLNCAFACFRGDVEPPNNNKGQNWLKRSAEAEWPEAEYMLGLCIVNGLYGFSKDPVEAIKWLRKAATHDWLEAQSVLGVKLIMGVDFPKDATEGIQWFRRAAEHGYAKGENDLGYALETNTLETPNLVEIGKWYLLAARQKLSQAKVNLDRIRSKLTEAQNLDVERRADMFQPKPILQLPPVKTETPSASQ